MAKRPHQDWVDGALPLLSNGGIDAVRIEPLAKQLGVSKGSFYWHFENRAALLQSLLQQWEQLGTSAIIELVERQGSDPTSQLRALAEASCTADPVANAVEVGVRTWGQTDPVAAEAVARVDKRRLDYVTRLLVSAGLPRPLARRRTLLFYRMIIGATTWQLAGGPAPSSTELDEITEQLLSPTH